MKGCQIDYELKKGMSSRFNQKMFGRISSRKIEYSLYSYYIPGVLDAVPYFRIFEGRIFLGTTEKVDFDPIMGFCEKFNLSSSEKSDEDIFVRTGRDRWKFHAKERGIDVEGL